MEQHFRSGAERRLTAKQQGWGPQLQCVAVVAKHWQMTVQLGA